MDAPRRPTLADPEFDPVPSVPVRLRDFEPGEHQRLLVNPFLGVLALMLWWRATLWLLFRGPFPPAAVLAVVPLILLPQLIQFHCLDCGQTGPYPRRDRHACPAVFARWNERKHSRFPVPSARSQLVFWCYVIGSVGLLVVVTGEG